MLAKLDDTFKRFNWMLDNGITNSAEVIQKDGGIILIDSIQRTWWDQFQLSVEGVDKQLLVFACNMPRHWVTNKNITLVNLHRILRYTLDDLSPQIKYWRFDHFDRQVDLFTHDFFMTYGNGEHYREACVAELEDMGVLDQSLYSRPATDTRPARSIENVGEAMPAEMRFDHSNNFQFMLRNTQRCHSAIVLSNEPFRDERCGHLNEKILWPILAQVPMLWAMNSHKRQQMQSWGFVPADTPRSDLRSFTEQLLWLRSVFRDSDRAQRWQDAQGNTINHNLDVLKGLADRIDEDTHRQLVPLGLA